MILYIERLGKQFQKMYNEQANKYGTSMSVGFALLIIDPVNGTPSTSIAPKNGNGGYKSFKNIKIHGS